MIRLSMSRKNDQRGVASLIISMITMVIISLIVIGFAIIARREQRQSLDQQLSTQAFYAAESGVEDVRNVIRTILQTNPNDVVPPKDNCTGDPSGRYPTGDKMIVDADYNVSYTCLTVDPSPKSLQFNAVNDKSLIIPINTDDTISSVRLTWSPTSEPTMPSSGCPNSVVQTLKPVPNWNCGYGMLRADLTPTEISAGPLSRTNLVGNTVTAFFEPTTGTATGAVDYASSRVKANLVAGDCDTAGGAYSKCVATIGAIPNGIRNLSLRLSSHYQPSNLKIEVFHDDEAMKINGVQALVDSTGKAGDVLRRIQVRLPVIAKGMIPDYAIQSNGSLCKHFGVSSGYFQITGIIDPDATNPMCMPQTDGAQKPCLAYNDVVFVLDRSGSMEDEWQTTTKIAKMKELTNNFINAAAIEPTKNHGAIVSFSNDGTIEQTLTADKNLLTAAVNRIQPDDSTIYISGLDKAVEEFNGPNARADAKRVVIFMSDGEPKDRGGSPAIVARAQQLKDAGVVMYTIGIADDLGTRGRQVLYDMSGNGGTYADAKEEATLDVILKNITLDLACQ